MLEISFLHICLVYDLESGPARRSKKVQSREGFSVRPLPLQTARAPREHNGLEIK